MPTELFPYAEGTDFDGEGVEIIVRDTPDGRRAVMLPARAKRLEPEDLEAYIELQHLGARIAEDQAMVEELVPQLRAGGCSWSLIGFAIGVTGETARQRWGDRLEGSTPP